MTRGTLAQHTSQLSLFDAPASVPAPAPAPAPAPELVAVAPQPSPPAVPHASVLSPAVFRHPQAQREIRLREHLVAYALRRARRRSIGFVVGLEGLSVAAPKWVGIGEIESALRE